MNTYWLQKHWQQWHQALSHERKPQAVIIHGSRGMGKHVFLHKIMADLLCREAPTHCGQCQNCLLFAQGHHPDVHPVKPEKDLIKVKSIRELSAFFTSTPHCSDFKIAVIEQADAMNTAAANSLLKVLEEPPARGILFLLTTVKHQLMPTIRSRCISLDLNLNAEEKGQLKTWLLEHAQSSDVAVAQAMMLAEHAPLRALALIQESALEQFDHMLDAMLAAVLGQISVNQAAKQMSECAVDQWQLLHQYFSHLMTQHLSADGPPEGHRQALTELFKKSPKVIHLLMKITEQVHHVMLNLNTQVKSQLLIESMLVSIQSDLSQRR